MKTNSMNKEVKWLNENEYVNNMNPFYQFLYKLGLLKNTTHQRYMYQTGEYVTGFELNYRNPLSWLLLPFTVSYGIMKVVTVTVISVLTVILSVLLQTVRTTCETVSNELTYMFNTVDYGFEYNFINIVSWLLLPFVVLFKLLKLVVVILLGVLSVVYFFVMQLVRQTIDTVREMKNIRSNMNSYDNRKLFTIRTVVKVKKDIEYIDED